MQILVVPAATTSDLRRAVLRPNWASGQAMHGDDDPAAVHVAAIDGATVAAACVLLPNPYPLRPEQADAWQLRGMAVAPERQGRGIGGRLLAGAIELLRGRGGRLAWCNARISAVRFYERHGFAVEGEPFHHEETGIAHLRMWRDLGRAVEPDPSPTSSS